LRAIKLSICPSRIFYDVLDFNNQNYFYDDDGNYYQQQDGDYVVVQPRLSAQSSRPFPPASPPSLPIPSPTIVSMALSTSRRTIPLPW
jgi:hypothetical protein